MQAVAHQLKFGRTRLVTGVEVHYAEQGDPGGEAIVFVHGWPDSWFSFSRVLSLLPERYHAFSFSQRGFGESERPTDSYLIDDFAADVVAFLDAVGVGRATLVGHSMGSFVTRRVAETSPDRVARLVLIGSAVSTENPAMREVDEVAQTLEDPLPVEFAREFAKSVIHVPVPPPFFEGVVTENLKAPARVWRDAWDGLRTFDDAAHIGQITAPMLILWGQHDVLFSWEDQQQLLAAVRNVKLIVYPGMGHSPNWERPEQVAADLQAFMSGERPEVSILNPAA